MNKTFFKILLIVVFLSTLSNATQIKYKLKTDKNLKQISQSFMWKRLIYFDKSISEVNDDQFLISKNRFSLKNELIDTINGYDDIDTTNFNNSLRCKFPARYYWLSKYIDFPNYKEIDERCTKLRDYYDESDLDSISVILVSGYLGNPASTFGHSFIKLNKRSGDNDLFDTSINYGALVPENENIVKYIFKGIFGGYEAGFSDKYFYIQDLIYNHNEFRDMWDYKLNLSLEQKKIIIYHLLEILGKKFNYYFLDKNCGYRVSQLIEIMLNKKILQNSKVWYVPVETFYKLEDLDKKNDIIKSIEYIPSYQLKIYKEFEKLNNKSKNFLIDYIKYLEVKQKDNKKFQKIKNKVYLKRLSLPISKSKDIFIKQKESPAKNNKLRVLSFGHTKYDDLKSYKTFSFTPFSIESLGRNNFAFSELSVFNMVFGFNNDDQFLDQFKIIDIKKYNSFAFQLEDKMLLSWNLDFGYKKINSDKKLKNSLYFNGDIGKVNYFSDDFMVHAMIKSYAYSRDSKYGFRPYIGLKNSITNDLKISLDLGYSYEKEKSYKYIDTQLQYNFLKNYALSLEYEDNKYSKYNLNFKYFF